jgi:hypothetical protein
VYSRDGGRIRPFALSRLEQVLNADLGPLLAAMRALMIADGQEPFVWPKGTKVKGARALLARVLADATLTDPVFMKLRELSSLVSAGGAPTGGPGSNDPNSPGLAWTVPPMEEPVGEPPADGPSTGGGGEEPEEGGEDDGESAPSSSGGWRAMLNAVLSHLGG